MKITIEQVIANAQESGTTNFEYKGKKYQLYHLVPSVDEQNKWAKYNAKIEEDRIKATYKAQQEASNNEFKMRARTSALQDAKHVERNGTSADVLKTADKLYQWLIKVLK
jgi:hypothetical protein